VYLFQLACPAVAPFSPLEQNLPSARQDSCISLTLQKAAQYLAPGLQQRMPDDQPQKQLQPLPPVLNDIVIEPIGKHLARQRWDAHPRALPLQDITEVLEVAVAAADDGVAQLEDRDVGGYVDFVARIHVAVGGAVGLRVYDLGGLTGFSETVFGGGSGFGKGEERL
jgi:hypothetical protein